MNMKTPAEVTGGSGSPSSERNFTVVVIGGGPPRLPLSHSSCGTGRSYRSPWWSLRNRIPSNRDGLSSVRACSRGGPSNAARRP